MLRLIAFLAAVASVQAATLERLSMDDMISKSSDIVRARVVSSRTAFRGPAGPNGMLYTWYTLRIVDRWKGPAGQQLEVAVPGGAAQGIRQTFAGAPSLQSGDEYVFFIWTSRSGMAQIIGLTQGLFDIRTDMQGRVSVGRAPTMEPMRDTSGAPVTDTGASYGYQELKTLVLSRLGGRTNR